VRASLIEVLGRYKGRIAVACFATNVARLSSIATAAQAHGRRCALVGRSLWRVEGIARSLGMLEGLPRFLDDIEASAFSPDRILYICTGSQGEPRAALSRIATGAHAHVKLGQGDTVLFSSRIIPGNERPIYRLHNQLARLGVEIVTEKDAFIHVSGHPARDEITRLYKHLKPRYVVPTHGERRHLDEHAKLATEQGLGCAVVIENGDMLRLGPGEPEVLEQVPTGRLAVDGRRLIPIGAAAIKERRKLAKDGSAVVTLVLDKNGMPAADPQVSVVGFATDEDSEDLKGIDLAVREAVEGMPSAARRDDDQVREVARLAVRRLLGERVGKRPTTQVHLVRL
jgi:ribonuclease J